MRRFTTFFVLAALLAVPGFADLRYKAKSSSRGDQPNSQSDMEVEVWVKGPNAEVHFRESGNPWMKSGFYLVTNDGGQTLFLVDPEKETYSEWDLDAILRFAGNVMQSLGGVMKFEITNTKYDLVAEKPDGAIHGLPVTYYKFTFSYDMLMKIMGIKKAQHFEGESEIWSTQELSDEAIGVWLRREPPETGYQAFDELAAAGWGRTEGVPLKMLDKTTVTTKKKSQTSWTDFEVVELDRSAGDPPDGYTFPDHYTQTQMMPTEAELANQEQGGSEGDDGKKKKKRFGLFDGGR